MNETERAAAAVGLSILTTTLIHASKRNYKREVQRRSRKRQSDYFLFTDTVKVVFDQQEDAYTATGYADDGRPINWRSGWGSTPLEALTDLVTPQHRDERE